VRDIHCVEGKSLRALCLALAIAVFASQGLVAAAATQPTEDVHLLVHFARGASSDDRAAAVAAIGGSIEGEIPALGVTRVVAAIERGGDPAHLIAALESRSDVALVERDARVHLDFSPNDPMWNTDPFVGLGQWGAKKIQLDRALDLVGSAAPVTVAVIDTGVDATHPDLLGRVLQGTTLLASQTGGCNADAIGTDDNSHGTHVAGIVAANANNAIGIAGIASNAKILPIKALDCTGSGSVADIAQGIVYAVDHGARVINISLGSSTDSATMQSAVSYATSRSVIVIAAAGNCGSLSMRCFNTLNLPEYPAATPGVIGVGATSIDDQIASFSTQGPQVAVSAPGVRIVSTVPHYATYQSDHGGPMNYAAFSGTSQATPFVSGLAALLLGIDPTLTTAQLASRIATTADDLGVPGIDIGYGAGRINAFRAVSASAPSFAARYDTSGAPRSATAGATYAAKVTLTNTSPGAWPATGTSAVKLGYHWLDANGNVVVWEGLRTPLPLDVLPGTTTVVSANVMAPPARGSYTLRFDLLREGSTWFSAKGVAGADVAVAVGSGLGASYATTAGSATLVTSAPAPLAVTLINTGTRAWAAAGANQVRLSYHWLRAGTAVVWDGARAPAFAADVQPGQTLTVQLPLVAPADLGAYTLRLDLVQEGVSWFSTEGVTPRDLQYLVTSGYAASYLPGALFAVLPGGRQSLKVGVHNDGAIAWSAAGANPVHLAAHVVDATGNVVSWDGARTALTADVAPGASDAYLVTVDAPLLAGSYRARVDLVREGVTWFSGLGVPTADAPLLVVADYRAQLPVGALTVSRSSAVAQAAITNITNVLWTASGAAPVRASVHWFDAAGRVLVWDGPRTELGHDVAPGETVTVTVALGQVPQGATSLAIDLVSEGVRWFGAGAIRPVTFTP
jgi:subtilisin family serine protease